MYYIIHIDRSEIIKHSTTLSEEFILGFNTYYGDPTELEKRILKAETGILMISNKHCLVYYNGVFEFNKESLLAKNIIKYNRNLTIKDILR